MKKGLIISALGVVSVLSFISLYLYIKSKEVKLEYRSYKVVKVNDESAEIEVLLSVFNPYLVDIVLKRLNIQVFIGDKLLSHLSESRYSIIRSNGPSSIPINLRINWSDIQGFTSNNHSNTQFTGVLDRIILKGSTSIRVLGLGVNDIPVFAEFKLNELF